MILNSIGSGLGSDCTGGVGSVGRKGQGGVHVDELVPVSLESDSVSVDQRIKEHAEEEGSERGFLGQKQRRGLHL